MPQWFVIYCTVNLFRLEMRNSLNVVSLLVVFVFLQKYNAATSSKMDRDTNNFCFWRSSAAHGARYSFLRESAGVHAVRLLQLYQSTWTEEQRLVECVLSDHPSVTGSYMSLCRGELADEFSDETDDRFNISQLLIPGGPCGTVPANDPLDLQVTPSQTAPTLRRHKRSWIFPGTLWCGTGSKAVGFGDLGVFNQTDQCCREHDHCEHTIAPFRVNFGVFNHHFFTVSHCNCDRRFRQCLLEVNDTVSHMVGFSFFTMLKVPCFRLTRKPYCTQLSWWGAIHNLLGSADGMTVTQPWTPSNGSSERHSAEIRHKDRLQLCEYYRSLEECRYKILPQERQYMLFNAEAKVLYHCNCIHRLYRELRRVRYPMDTHMLLLLESLSPSCFVFKDCPEHSISRCPASLSQVEKFMLTLDTKKHKQGEKSLEEAAPTVKKDKIRKSLRRSASFRLHNKCLRITDFHE
ncbi:group 3 secretory phospholipase A2-like isoform X2 [Brienomyrus brachyistius]|uniref:group 3 secretory phospholipase A2-like isoform X2 n=1 Tax=Brienomyrus brachyistius TaxID=42636 RepID=UPI0020B1F2A9|nr:group 3 secretory phospholipase A2-like isoform X2 [Brienomyrus brachyistius]